MAKKKTKVTKIVPGKTNAYKRTRPQVQRPKHDQAESTKRIGFATSGVTGSMAGGNVPYIKPGVTKKEPGLHRVPRMKQGVWWGNLRKKKRKPR